MMSIEEPLARASSNAKDWTSTDTLETARRLGGDQAFTIDWDTGAGETWVRVIRGHQVIAIISTILPFAMAIWTEVALVTEGELEVQLIRVPSLKEPILSCDRELLVRAFGESARFDRINTSRFSVDDLWYVTV